MSGIPGSGLPQVRFVYCAHHGHDESEPCTDRCRHDPKGCRHVFRPHLPPEGSRRATAPA